MCLLLLSPTMHPVRQHSEWKGLRMILIWRDPVERSTVSVLQTILEALDNNCGRDQVESAGRNGPGATKTTTTKTTTRPAAASGVKLRSFSCAYTLSRSDKKELGMSGLDYDQTYRYRQAGKLVVMMGHQHYIRKEDKS